LTMLVCALQNGKTAKVPCTSRSALFERAMMPISQMGLFIAENGGRSRPRRQPSVCVFSKSPYGLWSPTFFGMIFGEKRRKNRHTLRIGRNPQFITSLWSMYAHTMHKFAGPSVSCKKLSTKLAIIHTKKEAKKRS
jgi:hypothetical protein